MIAEESVSRYLQAAPTVPCPDDVLTRLHTRYDQKTLSEDLLFREAPPVVGGRATVMVGLAAASLWFSPAVSPTAFTLSVSLLSAALVAICWKTGEPPRWRWGKD